LDSYSRYVNFKVCIIAKEFSQIPREDFGEIFSFVTKFFILCVFLALTAYLDFEICQVSVVAIYLEGNLNENIYIEVLDCHDMLKPLYFILIFFSFYLFYFILFLFFVSFISLFLR